MRVARTRASLVLLAAGISAWMASDAAAFWGSSGSWGGYARYGHGSLGGFASSGGYGSYGGGSYGGYTSHHGGRGSHGGGLFRRIGHRIHARRASHGSGGSFGGAAYGSHGGGSYGGGYVASYASCGSHGGYGSYGGGGHGSYGGGGYSTGDVIYDSVPATSDTPAPPQPPTPSPAGEGPMADSGILRLSVPDDARVYVNDRLTTSTGSKRQYISKGLEQGRTYTYHVRVEFDQNGTPVTRQATASLTAGSEAQLSFDQNQIADTSLAETKLTLHVPADADVTLAGVRARQGGVQREFVTTRLSEGQTWEDYTVSVSFEQNGRKVVQERSITLRGGESQELRFGVEPAATLAAK